MGSDPSVESGVLILDKPAGFTSHQAVAAVRRAYGTRKVGHAGTLDPMATGVLVIGVNRATRLLGHLMATEKEYRATIRIGIGTITDDAEGTVSAAPGAAGVDASRVREALRAFVGDIDQVPSSVSAIKVDGKRSYARVRAGEQVELAARRVRIDEVSLLATRIPADSGAAVLDCEVAVRCSSGTYVRALARDLGAALGSAAHLTALRRTRVGQFGVDRAAVVDELPVPLISLATAAASCLPVLALGPEQARDATFGRTLQLVLTRPTALTHNETLLAIYQPGEPGARPVAVFVGSRC